MKKCAGKGYEDKDLMWNISQTKKILSCIISAIKNIKRWENLLNVNWNRQPFRKRLFVLQECFHSLLHKFFLTAENLLTR